MVKHKPSKEQEDIFHVVDNDTTNILINAVAGSGKTTTLLMLLERIAKEKSILFMAFNKSIADELKERVGKSRRNVDIMTVHSYGKKIIDAGGVRTINNYKYEQLFSDIINSHEKNSKEGLKKYLLSPAQMSEVNSFLKYYIKSKKVEPDFNIGAFKKNVINLCRHGRLSMVDHLNGINGVMQMDDIKSKHGYEDIYGDSNCGWILMNLGMELNDEIDFTDMISLPIRMKMKQPKYDFVFIDECQDLNATQRELMLGAINEGGRFISVGDNKQSIYGFAGADVTSFNKIKEIENTVSLPLSVSYRCPKQIIDTIKHLNPLIRHNEGNEDGVIVENFKVDHLDTGDMVLCRMTKPLVGLCLKLLSEGKKAYLMGTDIGLSLINLIKDKKRAREEYTMSNVFGRLYKDLEKILIKLKSSGLTHEEALDDDVYASLKEKIQTLEILSDNIEEPELVIDNINELFKDEKGPGICLSTVHKSKGLEAERVLILNRELMPMARAKKSWELEQEDNLIYVAHTRSKKILGFIGEFEVQHKSRESEAQNIKESKHVGVIGDKIALRANIDVIKKITTKFGETNVYDMSDDEGNVYTLFGDIKTSMLLDDLKMNVEVGDRVDCYCKISGHAEYNGNKTNKINRLTKF